MSKDKLIWGLGGLVVGLLLLVVMGKVSPGVVKAFFSGLGVKSGGQQADQSNIRVAGGSTTFWSNGGWTLVDQACPHGSTPDSCLYYAKLDSAARSIVVHKPGTDPTIDVAYSMGSGGWTITTEYYAPDGKPPSAGAALVQGAKLCSSADGKSCGAWGSAGPYYVVLASMKTATGTLAGAFFPIDLPPAADANGSGLGKRFHTSNCMTQNGEFCDDVQKVLISTAGKGSCDTNCEVGCDWGHCIVGIQ